MAANTPFRMVRVAALVSSIGLLAIERFWIQELADSQLVIIGFGIGVITALMAAADLVRSRFNHVCPLVTLLLSLWFLTVLLVRLSRY
jgi:hypothetical protein